MSKIIEAQKYWQQTGPDGVEINPMWKRSPMSRLFVRSYMGLLGGSMAFGVYLVGKWVAGKHQ